MWVSYSTSSKSRFTIEKIGDNFDLFFCDRFVAGFKRLYQAKDVAEAMHQCQAKSWIKNI
jgi:hypothetical protein